MGQTITGGKQGRSVKTPDWRRRGEDCNGNLDTKTITEEDKETPEVTKTGETRASLNIKNASKPRPQQGLP